MPFCIISTAVSEWGGAKVSWLAPYIFWLVPLCLLPVMIYYWMRLHPMQHRWGAHYVLDRALRRLQRKVINEHVLLLLIRVLAALLLILGFARLVFQTDEDDQVIHSGIHRVLILDASYSMLAGEPGKTRWDVSLEAMRRLLANCGRGESWSLYVMDDDPGWLVEYAVVGQDLGARKQLDALQPCESPASLSQALNQVGERFVLGDVDLFLFVDDQATTWKNLAQLTAELPPLHTYWLSPENLDARNISLTYLETSAERCLKNHPVRIFAKARHFEKTAQDVRVEFLQDGEVVGSRTASLQPGLEGQVFFDVSFDSEGPHYVTARVANDGLRYDDMLDVGLQVEAGLNVLLLSHYTNMIYETTAQIFVKFDAVQMEREGDKGALAFSMTDGPCTEELLEGKDVAFLDASSTLDTEQTELLLAFVRRGGGLLLAPGMGTDKKLWNSLLGGAGLLPSELGPDPKWAYNPSSSICKRLSSQGFTAPVMEPFATLEAGLLGEPKYFHWFELAVNEETFPAEDILAQFDDGQPYILRKKVGLGQVVLLASGLNGTDNTLPARETFVPLLYRLFCEASRGAIYPRRLKTGDPIQYRIRSDRPLDALAVQLGGENPIPLKIKTEDNVVTGIHAAGFDHSGRATIISVRGGDVSRISLGIQGERRDSDLTPLPDNLKHAWIRKWGVDEVNDGADLIRVLLRNQAGFELYPLFLATVLLLLLLELAYQRRFRRVL